MSIEIGITKLAAADRVAFFKTLSGWLNAGNGRMPVSEAIANTCDAFSHDEYATLRVQMSAISRDVQGGQTRFYEAIAQAKIGFLAQEINIIRAAEESNQLRQTIPALASALNIQHSGMRQLKSQLTMPLVVGLMLIVMSIGVLVFMLPMVIEPVLQRKPESLEKFPAILQYYWHASVWLRSNYLLASIVGVTPLAMILFRKSTLLSPFFEKIKMRWNASRRLVLAFNSLVTVYFLPALVRSGLPFYTVLDELSNCISNPMIATRFQEAARDHESGQRAAESLQNIPFRASFVNAISAGEATGSIADRVEELQPAYEIELERQIKGVVSKLKFLVMAILLPFFIISTYTSLVGPIFALMEY